MLVQGVSPRFTQKMTGTTRTTTKAKGVKEKDVHHWPYADTGKDKKKRKKKIEWEKKAGDISIH